MKEHNKLVRDRIPEIISSNGATAHIRHIDSDEEYVKELSKKLIEESREVHESPNLEELADVKEVLDALVRAMGHTREELERVQLVKAEKNGRFKDRVFLIDTEG